MPTTTGAMTEVEELRHRLDDLEDMLHDASRLHAAMLVEVGRLQALVNELRGEGA